MRLFIAVLCVCCLSLPVFAGVKDIDNQELKQLQAQGIPLFDIRTPREWKQTGIVQNSYTLMFFDAKGRYNVETWLAEFQKVVTDKDQPFILICRSGNRTNKISHFLHQRFGYQQVYNVKKGIRHWIQEGRPVDQVNTAKAISSVSPNNN